MVASNNAINNTVGASISGVTNTLTVTNPSNTASSAARTKITVGGGTAGDPMLNFNVSGVTDWTMGIDNNDSDKLKISQGTALGTNDTWIMTTAGERTMPLQPAFSSQVSVASAVTGDGTAATIIFDTEYFDQSSDYNNATGIFTAPIDGIYVFNASVFLSSLTASFTSGAADLYVNGILNTQLALANVAACRTIANTYILCNTQMIQLSATDQVKIVVTVSGGTKTVKVSGWFTGGLLL